MTRETREPDSFSGREVRSLLAVLWRAELPIAMVMQRSRELGDAMTVRDVFLLAGESGDPLAAWIEVMCEDIS